MFHDVCYEQCQIIYPRQQLFTMFELETMGFAESEVSEHSLNLRKIAMWVQHNSIAHYTVCAAPITIECQSEVKQPEDNILVGFFSHFRKSRGLSGRALRKLPFLAHALFVKVSIRFFFPHSAVKKRDLYVLILFVCRHRQWLSRASWRLWTKRWINKGRKKLTWSMVSELDMIVCELSIPCPYIFL